MLAKSKTYRLIVIFIPIFEKKRNSTVSDFWGRFVGASWSSSGEEEKGRGEGPIIILTASLLSPPCLPLYRPTYCRVSLCITVYCPNRVLPCIGTENLRSHTKPVSSASSTALAFSWFGIRIVSNQITIMLSLEFLWVLASSNQLFSTSQWEAPMKGHAAKQPPMQFPL